MLLPRVHIKQEWVQNIKKERLVSYLSAGPQLVLTFLLSHAHSPSHCPFEGKGKITWSWKRGQRELESSAIAKNVLALKAAGLEPPDNGDPNSQRLWVYYKGSNGGRIEKASQNGKV